MSNSTDFSNPAIVYDIEIFQHLFYVLFKPVSADAPYREFLLTSDQSQEEQIAVLETLSRYVNSISKPVIANDENNIKSEHAQLVGFNSIHFDDPLLRHVKNMLAEKKIPEDLISSLYVMAQDLIASSNYNSDFTTPETVYKLRKKNIYPISLDLFSLLSPLPSLKKIEIRTRYSNVQDLPYPFDYPDAFTPDQINTIIQYCHNDVDATTKLYLSHGEQAHALRVRLQEKYKFENQTLESLSEPQTAEQTMLKLYAKETTLTPDLIKFAAKTTREKYIDQGKKIIIADIIPEWIEFDTPELITLLDNLNTVEVPVSSKTGHPDTSFLKQQVTLGQTTYQLGGGGLHSVDTPAIITPTINPHTNPPTQTRIIDVDVASYYPAILINDKLHPEHLKEDFATLYQTIRDERLVAKSTQPPTPTSIADAYALKITINALFGKTASRWSPFYDPALMLTITLTGQLALLMLIEMFEQESITVISANTDGVTVELQDYDQQAFTEVCEDWESYTNFELEETHYAKIARRDVNNYCALTTDTPPQIKRKGVFTRPSLKHDVKASIVQQMAEAHLLYDKPIHPDSLDSPPTIYDYLYHFSATKTFRVHTRTEPGKTLQPSNRWYISTDHNYAESKLQKTGGKNKTTISIPNSDRARILNRVTNPTTLPADLDIDYYIQQAEKLVSTIILKENNNA